MFTTMMLVGSSVAWLDLYYIKLRKRDVDGSASCMRCAVVTFMILIWAIVR